MEPTGHLGFSSLAFLPNVIPAPPPGSSTVNPLCVWRNISQTAISQLRRPGQLGRPEQSSRLAPLDINSTAVTSKSSRTSVPLQSLADPPEKYVD